MMDTQAFILQMLKIFERMENPTLRYEHIMAAAYEEIMALAIHEGIYTPKDKP